MSGLKRSLISMTVAGVLASPAVFATNGMNLEGYGPVATGMGGASMAYDNGTAAMMNNPATIGLMQSGTSRLDVAIGSLAPDISSENSIDSDGSSGGPYMMPAGGWVKKEGKLAYGIGMFAQGGMGAEYAAGSSVDQSANGFSFANPAPSAHDNSGHVQRSELGVGRLLVPLSYEVNDKLNVGGSIDFVWGGLDILWSMDATNFFGGLDSSFDATLAGFGVTASRNRANISGNMVSTFLGAFGAGNFTEFHWGHFAFSNGSDFTQEASGSGFAGKLGFTYQVSNKLTVGGTYHSETSMGDLKGDIVSSFNVELGGGGGNATIDVPGTVAVKDFQWPQTLGLGIAYKASDKLFIAADWKRLDWSSVMKDFHMVITANDNLSGIAAGFSGTVLDFVYFQNWEDQDVINLGMSYQQSDQLVLRAGMNLSSNPVPSDTVSHLFPATIEKHFTAGVGYAIDKEKSVDFSLTYAPEVTVTEGLVEDLGFGAGEEYPASTISHSQTNWQLMYTQLF